MNPSGLSYLFILIFIFGLQSINLLQRIEYNIDAIKTYHFCTNFQETEIGEKNLPSVKNTWWKAELSRCGGDILSARSAWKSVLVESAGRLNLIVLMNPLDLELALFAANNYPEDANVYIWLGNAYLEKGKITDSLLAYEHALSIDDTNGDAWYRLGRLYKSENIDMGRAINAFEQTCIYPDRLVLGCPLVARTYFEMEQYELAVKRYELSLELIGGPRKSTEWGLINALLELGRTDEAVLHLSILANLGDASAESLLLELK